MVLRSIKSVTLLLFSLAFMAGCGSGGQPPITSPNGSLTLQTSIEHSRSDPGAYLCVVFEIRDRAGKVLHRENTRASNNSRWSMRWIGNDRIRLDSGDIGTYDWTRQPDGTWKKQ